MTRTFENKNFRRVQVEAMAMACCYAGFSGDAPGTSRTPLAYWRDVSEENKQFYRWQAEALIHLVQHMPTVKP